ncbi:MAG: TolC family protein [Myxococcota bacterium]
MSLSAWGWITVLAQVAHPVLTVEQAVERALTNAPLLKRAQAESRAAEAEADMARAPLLPQVTATAYYRRTTANRVYRVGTPPEATDRLPPPNSQMWDRYSFGITGTQLIYDWGLTLDQYRAARAAAMAEASNVQATRNDVALNARLAFYAARAQRSLVEVAHQALENQQRHLNEVEGFVQARLRPEIDLAQARLGVSNAKLAQVQAENAYDAARADLSRAMGTDEGIDYDVAEPPLAPLPFEVQSTRALMDRALKHRAEFTAHSQQIEAQELALSAARGGYGPALSLTGNVSEVGPDLTRLRWNYYGQVTLTWHLFQGLGTVARSNQAKAALDVARAERQDLRQRVAQELEKARLGVRAASAALAVAGDGIINASERLRLAESRYQAGIGSALELADAQLAQVAAEMQRVNAEYTLQAARATLAHAVGQ